MTHPGGRPPKYNGADEMQELIEEYFESCKPLDGIKVKHPTITGLGLALDLTRKGLIEYANKNDEFGNTIKRAKSRVEEYNEQCLFGTGVTGVIFNLKNNFDWRDAQDHNIAGQKDGEAIKTSMEVTFIKSDDTVS